MTLTPSTWQTGSVRLKRAADPAALSRVAGLELMAACPPGAWPGLLTKGGARASASGLVADTGVSSYDTITRSPLGAISVPGDAIPSITETSGWERVTLSYAAEFDLTLSRLTAAMLLETSKTSLRLCAGNVQRWTTNGTTIANAGTVLSTPKYAAYHTAAGYQVALLSSVSVNLTGMDEPWLLVYWGVQSHWLESTVPLNTSHNVGDISYADLEQRYAFQADCPLLLTFGVNPTAIVQTAGQGGFDLTFGAAATALSILPLYGRARQQAAVTDGWSTGANLAAGAKTLIQAWYPRCQQFPRTVSESYAYSAAIDIATVTTTIGWTTVRASGSPVKFAPIKPLIGTARATSLAGLGFSGSVVDGGLPTEYGPSLGIVGVDTYTRTFSGLAPMVNARPAPGPGAIPAALQTRINTEVTALVAQAHWAPWYRSDRWPHTNTMGDVYFADSAETLAFAAEAVPLVRGSRQLALKNWLRTEQTAYPVQTAYSLDGSGTPRGPDGIPGVAGNNYTREIFRNYPGTLLFEARRWLWGAWALSRFYQVTGDAVSGAAVTALIATLDSDQAERDWATGARLAGGEDRGTAIEDADRHWAGLCGLAWLTRQVADADTALVWALLAEATLTRVAMGHLPRWQASVGLITLPTDRGSTAANNAWLIAISLGWVAPLPTFSWASSADDSRSVIKLTQFEAFLDFADIRTRQGTYVATIARATLQTYRWLVKPLGTVLAAALGSAASVVLTKYAELQPHWWLPDANPVVGIERNTQAPHEAHGLLKASAWLAGSSPATLDRQSGYPQLASGADLFSLEKAAIAADAYASTLAAPILSDTFAGVNGTDVSAHAPEIGGPWVVPSGMVASWYKIQGNRATSTNIGSGGVAADLGSPNVAIDGVITTTSAGNFMSVRMAAPAAFTTGVRFVLNRLNNALDFHQVGGGIGSSTTPAVDPVGSHDYPLTLRHYRGHFFGSVGQDIAHWWENDVLRGWALPTGTWHGPDWTSTNAGEIDNLVIRAITRSQAVHLSVIGDSISVFERGQQKWPQRVAETWNGGITSLRSRPLGGEGLAVAGASGLTALAQANAIVSGSDDPDYVLIHIGVNDLGGGSQAQATAVIDALVAGGIPVTKIRWIETFDYDHVSNAAGYTHSVAATRAAIAAACAARGVTLWLSWTGAGGPWFTATNGVDTADGLHPNASGNAKIAAKVLTILADEAEAAPASPPAPVGPYASAITDTGTVAKRSKFEITFDVLGSVATNTFLKYEAAPPAGQSGTSGVSVYAELSDDNYATTITRRCFVYQAFDEQIKGGADWKYPQGFSWKARFAPPRAGSWQYRIRCTDAGGTNLATPVAFTVTAAAVPGRLRRASADTRYFERENGSYAPLVGFNLKYGTLSFDNPTVAIATLNTLAASGVNHARIWATDWGWWGSEGRVWQSTQPGDQYPYVSAYLSGPPMTPLPGHELGRYVSSAYSSSFLGHLKRAPACKRSTTYQVDVDVQIPVRLTGPVQAGQPFGFAVKTSASWIFNYAAEPEEWNKGTLVTTPVAGVHGIASFGYGTTDGGSLAAGGYGQHAAWKRVTGTIVTGAAQDFLDYVILTCHNCTANAAYYANVQIREVLGAGAFGPNIVSQESMDRFAAVDQRACRQLDLIFDAATSLGITLQAVVLGAKQEPALAQMADNGTISFSGGEDSFFGASGSRARWIAKNATEQFQARYGHADIMVEMTNEMSAYGFRGITATQEWAVAIQARGDSPLVGTSTSFDRPKPSWDSMPALDWVDLHLYRDAGTVFNMLRVDVNAIPETITVAAASDFDDTASFTSKLSLLIGAKQPYGLNRPMIRGETGLIAGSNTDVPADLSADTAGIWWHKYLWAQLNHGGMADLYWYVPEHLYNPSGGAPNHLAQTLHYRNFVQALPLNNGQYVDAAATPSDATNLRVFGQKDLTNNRAYLWIDNKGHTYRAVINGTTITAGTGTVAIPGLGAGSYTVTWRNSYTGATILTETVIAPSSLVLTLPASVSTDLAVTVEPVSSSRLGQVIATVGYGAVYGGVATVGYGATTPPTNEVVATGGYGSITGAIATGGYGGALTSGGVVLHRRTQFGRRRVSR